MFERFRIKATLREEMIRMAALDGDRPGVDAEQFFFMPAFIVAPVMKRERMTAAQAMVFMVTSCIVQAEQLGDLAQIAAENPPMWNDLQRIYRHILAKADADPSFAPFVYAPAPGEAQPFSSTPPVSSLSSSDV